MKFDPTKVLFWGVLLGLFLVGVLGLLFGSPVAGVDK